MKINQVIYVTIIAAIAAVYWFTFARFPINYADSLELVTAAKLGGIAHPPGYPLYTWLLHLLTNLPTIDSAAKIANFSSVVLQLLSLTVFIFINQELAKVVKIKPHGKTWLVATSAAVATLAFSYQFWYHSLIAEVFALNHLLLSLVIFCSLKWINTKHQKWLLAAVIALGVGLSHHQTIGFIIPGWLLFLITASSTTHQNLLPQLRKNVLRIIAYSLTITLAFLLPFALLFYFNHQQAAFSWYFEPTVKGVIDTILRKIYTHEGSAIETYTREINLKHSLQSLIIYLKFLVQNLTLPAVLLLIPTPVILFKKSKPLLYLLTGAFIVSGPLLAMYLKFPIEHTLSDAGYYAGTALRLRMFLINFYVAGLLLPLGINQALNQFKSHKLKIIAIMLTLAMPIYQSMSNYRIVNRSQVNFDHFYYQQILNDLPANAFLIVQSDSTFGVLYEQLVEHARPDLTIIPVTTQMRYHYFQSIKPPIQLFDYPDQIRNAASIISWNLYQGHQIFILDPDPETLSYLGVEGNPFYIIPSGYVFEIAKNPRPVAPYNYALTFSIFDLTAHPKNLWENSTKGIFAVNHTLMGYFNYKAGSSDAGIQHFVLAGELARSTINRSFIEAAHQDALDHQNLYLNSLAPQPQNYLDLYHQDLDGNSYLTAHEHILKATFLDPTSSSLRQKLAESYSRLGDTRNATLENQHAQHLINSSSPSVSQ